MLLFSLTLNLISVYIITKFVLFSKFDINKSLVVFGACSLFFVKIPLLFDSAASLFTSSQYWGNYLTQANNNLLANYRALNDNCIFIASSFAFLFDCIIIVFYIFAHKFICHSSLDNFNKKNMVIEDMMFFPWYIYFLFAIIGLLCFILNYGLDFSDFGFGYRSRHASNINKFLLVLSPLFFSMSCPGLNLSQPKALLRYLCILFPISLIALAVESRELYIAAIIFIIYFFISKKIEKKIYINFVCRILGAFLFLCICANRMRKIDFKIYPIWRDFALCDYYFVIDHFQDLFNNYLAIDELIKTGWTFIFERGNNIELVEKIADYKFAVGWGGLHPTGYGWCYIDGGWYALFYALFFGFVMFLSDLLQSFLDKRMAFLYTGVKITFITVFVRGSCQVAYANFYYQTLFFIFITLILRLLSSTKYKFPSISN